MMKNEIDDGVNAVNVIMDPDSGIRIFKDAWVKNCILKNNVLIRNHCRLENCVLGSYVQLQRNAMMYFVEIGERTYTGKNFTAWHCKIGKFCSISWNVSIGGANHDFHRITSHAFLYANGFGINLPKNWDSYDRFSEPCEIGNDVWIACHAIINRGVKIGDGAVIAAGAVVTKDVAPYSIVAGVPAKVIGRRCTENQAKRLQETAWWDFPQRKIEDNISLFNQQISDESITAIENIALNLRTDL